MESNGETLVSSRHGYRRNWLMLAATAVGAAGVMLTDGALAQVESVKVLSERSAIVLSGQVLRVNASIDPLQAASPRTVVVRVLHMYSGAEIAGDQTGRTATVVLSDVSATMKPGTKALFFGNPRFVGKSLTIADEGELLAGTAAADLERVSQPRRDQPLRERIAGASSVFVGKVESERALSAAAGQPANLREPPSEHDPEWHVASVRVLTALQGAEQGALVSVVFPASRDIMWFNAPKLKAGQEAIFVTHKPDKDDKQLMEAPGVADFLATQSVQVVSEPFDTVPASDEGRVRALLARGR